MANRKRSAVSVPSLVMPTWAADFPSEWGWKRLWDVCEAIVDCPHSTPQIVEGGPYLMARTPDILSGVFRANEARRVSESTFIERVARTQPRAGDLLYSREGTYFGISAEVPLDTLVCLGQRMVLLRPDPSMIDTTYLRIWLNSPIMQLHLHGHRDGSVAERLNLPTIRALPVCIPPMETQRTISRVLGTLDDKIELNRKMSQTLEEMARALFKSWFIDFDPVHAKAAGKKPYGMDEATAALFPNSFEDSELGRIPKGWRVMPLDEVASFRNGLALQRYRPEGGSARLPVVKIAQLRTGRADSGEWARADIDSECVLQDGDVVFSWSGSLMVVLWCGGEAALNQHLFKVTSATHPRWFFYHWVIEHLAEFQRIASAKATTMGHIQRHHLSSALCVVPDQDLIEAATACMSPYLERVVKLQLESRTLAELRDAFLPKLLSGELRVGGAEKEIGAVA